MSSKSVRCAIYTRKSSDEGLDQSFNSLDAQREAGDAYVKSQAHEGWSVIPSLYDDGGYSGGTMERPGLQRLLADVDTGLVDVVVVYKIDRLTRSLPDFARIVERFDARDVSFVSVTQSFNTTSSMGRLTLNVLLSFAQFEREVTGERIRDKIAASKAKGMWMGGNLPLGYDLPAPGTRILQVNDEEAATVRHIFCRYLELGSVHALQRDLAKEGITSKRWMTSKGKIMGGLAFNRGALFHLLRNPIYRGKIRHKGVVHEGGHDAIIEADLFDKVQQMLERHTVRRREATDARKARSRLTGRLFDTAGEVMSPSFSRGSNGRLYRYYVSASLQQGGTPRDNNIIRRVAATELERALTDLLTRWLPRCPSPLDQVRTIRVRQDGLQIDLPADLEKEIVPNLQPGETIIHSGKTTLQLIAPLLLTLRGGKRQIIAGAGMPARQDPSLIAALRKAHGLITTKRGRPLIKTAPASQYDRKILRLAFLAPDLQRDILAGRQPPHIHLEALKAIDIPTCWSRQREVLGWQTAAR